MAPRRARRIFCFWTGRGTGGAACKGSSLVLCREREILNVFVKLIHFLSEKDDLVPAFRKKHWGFGDMEMGDALLFSDVVSQGRGVRRGWQNFENRTCRTADGVEFERNRPLLCLPTDSSFQCLSEASPIPDACVAQDAPALNAIASTFVDIAIEVPRRP